MCKVSLAATAFCFLVTLVSCHYRERRSGISDQRLAEIETLLAMAKQGGNKDIAYGIIDPIMLGKRKRSHMDLSSQLEEDFPVDLLREARLQYPSLRREASITYPHRFPERIFRFRANELENRDLQGNDDAAK